MRGDVVRVDAGDRGAEFRAVIDRGAMEPVWHGGRRWFVYSYNCTVERFGFHETVDLVPDKSDPGHGYPPYDVVF